MSDEKYEVIYAPLFDYAVRYVDLVGREVIHVIKQAPSPGKALIRFHTEVPSSSRIKILGVKKVQAISLIK